MFIKGWKFCFFGSFVFVVGLFKVNVFVKEDWLFKCFRNSVGGMMVVIFMISFWDDVIVENFLITNVL